MTVPVGGQELPVIRELIIRFTFRQTLLLTVPPWRQRRLVKNQNTLKKKLLTILVVILLKTPIVRGVVRRNLGVILGFNVVLLTVPPATVKILLVKRQKLILKTLTIIPRRRLTLLKTIEKPFSARRTLIPFLLVIVRMKRRNRQLQPFSPPLFLFLLLDLTVRIPI